MTAAAAHYLSVVDSSSMRLNLSWLAARALYVDDDDDDTCVLDSPLKAIKSSPI